MRLPLAAVAAGWMWLVWVLTASAGAARARERLERASDAAPAADSARGSGRRFLAWPRRLRARGGEDAGSAAAWGDLAGRVAGSLRSGRTVTQSLEDAAAEDELPAWLLERVRACLRLRSVGVSLDRGLDALSEPRSEEADLLLTVLRVGRRAGSGLPQMLDEFASSMRERAAVAVELRTLTTQARLSGRVLCLLPLGFLGFVLLTSGRDVLPVLASPAGLAVVVSGVILQAGGAWWIRSIVRVEP